MIDPSVTTSVKVGELPPLDLTVNSVIPHEIAGELYKSDINQLLQLIRPLVGKLQYEVVELDVPMQYVMDNFDLTPGPNMGLGRNLCQGFAICNGNNGTKNRDGRSSIGYGSTFGFTGVFGGNKDAVVVEHSHAIGTAPNDDVGYVNVKTSSSTGGTGISTATTGVSGIDKNYHPYIVTLTIMKL